MNRSSSPATGSDRRPPRVLAVIQARCGSTRLPGKVLMRLAGLPVLAHVIDRVAACRLVDDLIVATTLNRKDLPLVAFCAAKHIPVYCGSEDDVLDRYYQVSRLLRPEHVVRITADCPLIDPKVIDRAVRLHLASGADYTTNTIARTYPEGQDVEVLRGAALQQAWRSARWSSEREHVTSYIRKHPKTFRLENMALKQDLSANRWSLDEPDDLRFLRGVFSALHARGHLFGMDEVLRLLARRPRLARINSHILLNAGYQKSLAQDRRLPSRRD